MKKTLCILLALLMLALTACQSAPENNGSNATESNKSTAAGEESTPEKPTPWSELKTLVGSIDPSVELSPALDNLMSATSDLSGTGTFETTMGLAEEGAQSISGNLTVDGDASKMEFVQDFDGLQVPAIGWTQGDISYIQFPTLYPDNVFDANEINAGSGMGSMPSTDIMALLQQLPDKLIAAVETSGSPDEDMTVTEADGVKTYTLILKDDSAHALFSEVNSIMEEIGISGLLASGSDILGQLGSGDSSDDVEAAYDTAVITVTSDHTTYINYQLEKRMDETVVETMLLNSAATDTSVTYVLRTMTGTTTDVDLTMTMESAKIAVVGELAMGNAAKIGVNVTVTATDDTSVTIEGTLPVKVTQEGTTMEVTMAINGSISLTEENFALQLGMSMEMFGMKMDLLGMTYNLTLGDVTVEIPYGEDDVLSYDAEAFLEKLMEVYPDHFETDSNFYVNEDGTVSVAFESENGGMFMTEGTYVRDGDSISVTMLGDYKLQGFLSESGGEHYWNGRRVDVRDIDGIINVVDIVTGAWYWSMFMYEDGTCTITASFAVNDDGSVNLASGHTISAENFLFADETTLLVYDAELKAS